MSVDTVDPEHGPQHGAQPRTPAKAPVEPAPTFRVAHPRISWLELVAVGAGGALGALARVAADQVWPSAPTAWPWATFAVNITGAFILGCLITGLRHGPISITGFRLLGTGFCGALTTFSTMQVELLQMLEAGRHGLAAGYLTASLTAGYGAVAFASRTTRRLMLSSAAATGEAGA